ESHDHHAQLTLYYTHTTSHKDATACTTPFLFYTYAATSEIYTLSLHDALPILSRGLIRQSSCTKAPYSAKRWARVRGRRGWKSRSEEHTSELQSRSDLVCRLLLEKKNRRRLRRGVPVFLAMGFYHAKEIR